MNNIQRLKKKLQPIHTVIAVPGKGKYGNKACLIKCMAKNLLYQFM
jgi:hypothetical protein